ncbi:hypothetical protein NIES2100_63710 [Calothrix sp. NIES-2100]|uniref:hypothetical protein n=1 Tax=Calothrix sp. NIES-2100 TaxID=1954172 RepID=UPI000B61F500|nr:hypothetical protein NIES2100_63710 [Calothrix sp. NIES-2100]
MQNLSDWVIVGSIALVVSATASFAGGAGGASGALLGSSTGVVLGVAISSHKQRKTEIEIKVLRQQVVKQEEWKKLNQQLTSLKAQVKANYHKNMLIILGHSY